MGGKVVEIHGKDETFFPMYFGISCSFVSIYLLSKSAKFEPDNGFWIDVISKMLQGSAQLLGLLVWKVRDGGSMEEKSKLLENSKMEILDLKKRRTEDARANEKVMSIFATREQKWLNERKKLRLQIQAILYQLQVNEREHKEIVSNYQTRIAEKEQMLRSKNKSLDQEKKNCEELDDKLRKAEESIKELRETLEKNDQEHSTELWKYKTTFIELVSNQRKMEAEMARILRKVEDGKKELEIVYAQKEESTSIIQDLSMEITKMQKITEEKDKILSAVLRKSKLDISEKQMLLKELKLLKPQRKQIEAEMQRLSQIYASKPLKFKSYHAYSTDSSKMELIKEFPHVDTVSSQNLLLGYLETNHGGEIEYSERQQLTGENRDIVIKTNIKQLDDLIRTESKRHSTFLERRHYDEIEAFAEQMRLKDEKLEAMKWRLLSSELELKKFQSQIEELEDNLFQLKEENHKLQILMLERDGEMNFPRERFSRLSRKTERKQEDNEEDEDILVKLPVENDDVKEEKLAHTPCLCDLNQREEWKDAIDHMTKGSTPSPSENCSRLCLTTNHAEEDMKENRDLYTEPDYDSREFDVISRHESIRTSLVRKEPPWKIDLQALAVSFKLKRLNQQILMLEKMTETRMPTDSLITEGNKEIKSSEKKEHQEKCLLALSLLDKQVKRYQSLGQKADDLCRRLKEKDDNCRGDFSTRRPKEETETLEHFLQETFELQRYVVATGQKLVEIQPKIFDSFEDSNESEGPDANKLLQNLKTLFREIQRGLEVRIARIIGDLEGTLAREGIQRLHY